MAITTGHNGQAAAGALAPLLHKSLVWITLMRKSVGREAYYAQTGIYV